MLMKPRSGGGRALRHALARKLPRSPTRARSRSTSAATSSRSSSSSSCGCVSRRGRWCRKRWRLSPPSSCSELLEKSVEITVGALAEGDLSSAVGLFLTNLEKEAGVPIPDQQVDVKDGQPMSDVALEEKGVVEKTKDFYYDEWDFRAGDYKPRWCRVLQRPLEEGDEAFFEETLRRYSGLAAETRKQFEQLRPELFRKIKRLLRRRRLRPRPRHRVSDREAQRPQLHRQGLLAAQQGGAPGRRRLPARHERLDRRGDREAQAEVRRSRLRRRHPPLLRLAGPAQGAGAASSRRSASSTWRRRASSCSSAPWRPSATTTASTASPATAATTWSSTSSRTWTSRYPTR